MNLISCDNCGIVLDKDKLRFPKEIRNDDGVIINKKAIWDDDLDSFVSFIPCPVCSDPIKGYKE